MNSQIFRFTLPRSHHINIQSNSSNRQKTTLKHQHNWDGQAVQTYSNSSSAPIDQATLSDPQDVQHLQLQVALHFDLHYLLTCICSLHQEPGYQWIRHYMEISLSPTHKSSWRLMGKQFFEFARSILLANIYRSFPDSARMYIISIVKWLMNTNKFLKWRWHLQYRRRCSLV